MKRLLLPLLAITLAFAPARGQDITGDWYGTLEIGPQKLALVFHISENEGRYATVMDAPTSMPKDWRPLRPYSTARP